MPSLVSVEHGWCELCPPIHVPGHLIVMIFTLPVRIFFEAVAYVPRSLPVC